MRSIPLALALLCSCPLPTLALPHNDGQLSSWRRLSNKLFERIWKLPEQRSVEQSGCKVSGRAGKDIAGTLLAQYGNDLVLRFNVSTADEATALADASDTLFLDVWGYSDNWVDIRLSKNVVCLLSRPTQRPTFESVNTDGPG